MLALLLPLSVTSAQQKATSGDGALKAVMTAPLEAMVVMRMLTVLMAAEAAAVAQLKVEVEVVERCTNVHWRATRRLLRLGANPAYQRVP